MPKKIVQDVLPPNERSIRRIPLSERQQTKMFPSQRKSDNSNNNNDSPQKSRKSKYLWWGLVVLAILILIKLFTSAEAQVTIKPKQQSVNLNETFRASKEAGGGNESLPFEIIKITEKLEEIAQSTGEEQLEKKASGEIMIFNRYSTNPQTLVRNTRFETPEGLIFRISDSVTVPGALEKNGETVPGQLKVRVFADQSGGKYNMGLSDFTIPGFAGMPQFEDFFARSVTEMTGGFSGMVKTVDSENLESIREKLQKQLTQTLRERIALETPDSFVLLDDSLKIKFDNLVDNNGQKSGMAKIIETGIAYAIMLDKEKLEEALVKKALGKEDAVKIENLKSLKYTIIETIEDMENINSFQFNIKDNPQLVWVINGDQVKKELVGQPIKNLEAILSKYPSIKEAEATIKPLWKRSFPESEEKIYIEVVY